MHLHILVAVFSMLIGATAKPNIPSYAFEPPGFTHLQCGPHGWGISWHDVVTQCSKTCWYWGHSNDPGKENQKLYELIVTSHTQEVLHTTIVFAPEMRHGQLMMVFQRADFYENGFSKDWAPCRTF